MAGVRARLIAALVSAVAVVASSACSGGGERPSGSVTVASPTAAASNPSTDVVLPPRLPPAASEHTVAGAEAAFKHFLDLYAYAFAAADPDPLRSVCSVDSEFCTSTIDAVEKTRETGASFRGFGFTDVVVQEVDTNGPDVVIVRAVVDQKPSFLVASPTPKTLKTIRARRQVGVDGRMVWDRSRWLVAKVNVAAERAS